VEWAKRSGSARNEPLDCRVYARAALEIANPDLDLLAAQAPREEASRRPERRRRIVSRGVY
jgi:phage terminase large subunit GpA-like protein